MRRGFTLIEMLVTLAIVGIVACAAYPSYLHYVAKARRIEGQTALLQLALQLEHYFIENHSYQGATLEKVGANSVSPHDFYTLQIILEKLSNNTYFLKATPIQNDPECASLTLDNKGRKGITGTGKISDCW